MTADELAHLEDPDPPVADAGLLTAVRARARRRRQRRRLAVAGSVAAAAVLLGATALIVHDSARPAPLVVSAGDPAPEDAPEGDVARCFPLVTGSRPDGVARPATPRAVDVPSWPARLPALLVLSADGDVWVVDDGRATPWAPRSRAGGVRYLWARWDGDGTVLASRWVEGAVVIDRVTASGAVQVVRFAYTVAAAAPPGVCPIEGKLATFAVSPGGVTYLEHSSVWDHSCPPSLPTEPSTTEDPWRCRSKEATYGAVFTDATGATRAATQRGSMAGAFGHVAADASGSDVIAMAFGDAPPGLQLDQPMGAPCCVIAPPTASAVSISPTGARLASTPDGHGVVVTNTSDPSSGLQLWREDRSVLGTASTQEQLVVATDAGFAVGLPMLPRTVAKGPFHTDLGPILGLAPTACMDLASEEITARPTG
jgi:hypothetical protein